MHLIEMSAEKYLIRRFWDRLFMWQHFYQECCFPDLLNFGTWAVPEEMTSQ